MIEFAFKHKLIKLQSDNYLDCSFFDNISFIHLLFNGGVVLFIWPILYICHPKLRKECNLLEMSVG